MSISKLDRIHASSARAHEPAVVKEGPLYAMMSQALKKIGASGSGMALSQIIRSRTQKHRLLFAYIKIAASNMLREEGALALATIAESGKARRYTGFWFY